MRSVLIAASLVCTMPSAEAARSAGCQPKLVAQLPVRLLGLHPVLLASINGIELPMVLDTGSGIDLLTYATAERLHLRREAIGGRATVAGVGGDSNSLTATAHADLKLGALDLPKSEFVLAAADLGSAAGALGRRFLARYDLDYDLRQGTVRLMKIGSCAEALPSGWSKLSASIADFTGVGSEPTVNGYVKDTGVRILFDTAAGTSLLDLRAAARAALSVGTHGAVADADAAGVGRQSIRTWLVPVSQVTIGDEQIRNTRLRIGHLSLGGADMILGTDFFLSHRVYFANSQRRLLFHYYGGPVFEMTPALRRTP